MYPYGAPDEIDANWGHIALSPSKPHIPCDPNNPPTFETNIIPAFQCDNAPNMGPAGTYSGSLLGTSKYYQYIMNCANGLDTQGIIPLSQSGCMQLQTPYGLMDATNTNDYYGYGWIIQYIPTNTSTIRILSHAGSNTYNYVKVMLLPELNIVYWVGTNSGSESDIDMVHDIMNTLPTYNITCI